MINQSLTRQQSNNTPTNPWVMSSYTRTRSVLVTYARIMWIYMDYRNESKLINNRQYRLLFLVSSFRLFLTITKDLTEILCRRFGPWVKKRTLLVSLGKGRHFCTFKVSDTRTSRTKKQEGFLIQKTFIEK